MKYNQKNYLDPINNWTKTEIIVSPGPNNILIGCTYLGITSFFIFIQIMTFITFYKKKNLMSNMPFRIMRHLGVSDIIQQSIHFTSAFYTIFLFSTNSIIVNCLASILQSAYITSVAFITLLTINRFDVFYQQPFLSFVNRKILFNCGIVICYICLILLIIFYMIPSFRLTFTLVNYGWLYQSKKNMWTPAWEVENKTVTFLLLLSFVLYVLIFCKIVYMRSATSSLSKIQFSDIRILAQGIFNFLSIVFLEWAWRYLPNIVGEQYTCATVLNYFFLFVSGNNTLSGLLLIKEIRNEIWNLIMCCFFKTPVKTSTSLKHFKRIINADVNIRHIS
uniref:7TM_GPCR_Srx domain-containing protein n=1 Tax=Strongyloides papillosus TaxID=174720 RepID=A0A0N5CG91_STREA